jgi:hypothetical protein
MQEGRRQIVFVFAFFILRGMLEDFLTINSSIPSRMYTPTPTYPSPPPSNFYQLTHTRDKNRSKLGCAVFATFFNRFEANRSEYGSYSLHIRMFLYIRKHHLFASFTSYSLQNIRLETNVCKTLRVECYIQANIGLQIFAYKRIFACKYSHSGEKFATYCFKSFRKG